MDNKMPTLEEYIITLDNHQLGWNGYTYANEACKKEEYQLRTWLQELRVRRRSCKTYSVAMRKVSPKSEPDIIEELIAENEELKAKVAIDGWHSVEKEMPPTWYTVLVYCENGHIDLGSYTTDGDWVSDCHMQPIEGAKYWKMVYTPPELWEKQQAQTNEKED